MIGRRRAALVSLIMSYAGLALSVVKGIVLVPIYFRYFSLSTYGSWLASANIVALLGLLDLGFGMVFYQRLAQAFGAGDTLRFARIAGCAIVITIITTPVFIVLGWAAAHFVPALVNADPTIRRQLAITFALSATGSALDLAWTNVTAVTHAWQRTAIAGWSRIMVQLVEVIGTVVFLWKGFGIIAFGVGSLAGALVGAGFATTCAIRIWLQLDLPKPTFGRSELRDLVSASLPVFLSRIVGHVASNVDVALVSALISPAGAAVYGLTDRLFRFALSFINPIAGSTLSALAHLLGEVGPKGVARPLGELFTVWSTVAALCFPVLLAMNRDFIAVWVGSDKYGGIGLSIAICVSTLLSARSFLMYIVLTGLGEIALTAWVSLVEPALRIPLMLLGLRTLGPVGLPLATSVAVAVFSLGIFPVHIARKIDMRGKRGVALQMRSFFGVLCTMVVGILLAIFLPNVNRWLTFIGKAVLVSIGVLVVALAASRDIRELLSRVLRGLRARVAEGR